MTQLVSPMGDKTNGWDGVLFVLFLVVLDIGQARPENIHLLAEKTTTPENAHASRPR